MSAKYEQRLNTTQLQEASIDSVKESPRLKTANISPRGQNSIASSHVSSRFGGQTLDVAKRMSNNSEKVSPRHRNRNKTLSKLD